MFKIAKIGIEFEFDIPNRIDREIPAASWLVREFNKENPSFIIDVDKEYYATQIEFKLRATWDIDWWIAIFKSFLEYCYMNLSNIRCVWNPFVWTHIHLFLEKDGEPYSKMARWKKIPIFDYVYSKFSNWIYEKDKESIIKSSIINDEALRLALNHNILRHFDRHHLNDWIRIQL